MSIFTKSRSVAGLLLAAALCAGSVRAQQPGPGQALYLGGRTGDFVSVNAFTGFPATAFTLECWVRTTNQLKNGTPFSYATPGGAAEANAAVLFNTLDPRLIVANTFSASSGVSVADGQWHHVAVTWTNSGEFRLYKDGLLAASSNTLMTGTLLAPTGIVVLGQDQDSYGGTFDAAQALEGYLDEVRLWSAALPEATIQSNRHRSLPSATPGLLVYYRFDEAAGLVATNSAGAGNHGLLSGSGAVRVASTAPVGLPPSVSSASATSIWPTAATIRGEVVPGTLGASWWIEWGVTTQALTIGTASALAPGVATSAVLYRITGLTPGTSTWYRLCASNAAGRVSTPFASLTTPTSWVVTVLADGAPGSLRDAVAVAPPFATIAVTTGGDVTQTGGALILTNSMTIRGPGPTNLVLRGSGDRLFIIAPGINVNLEGLQLREGTLPAPLAVTSGDMSGGAIFSQGALALTNCVLAENMAASGLVGIFVNSGGEGGAIHAEGPLSLMRCAFLNNRAGEGGSAFLESAGGNGGAGGAVRALQSLRVEYCFFSGNQAGAGGVASGGLTAYPGGNGGAGGAIAVDGAFYAANSTWTYEHAGNGGSGSPDFFGNDGFGGVGGSGGAIRAGQGGLLVNCTITASQTGNSGANVSPGNTPEGGGILVAGGALQLLNTLIAGNAVQSGGTGIDVAGPIASLGHNLLGSATSTSGLTNGVNGDRAGSATNLLDPALLGAVIAAQPAYSHVPLAQISPAINAGDNAVASTPYLLAVDARGFQRLSGQNVDIGSYELDLSGMVPPAVLDQQILQTISHALGGADVQLGGQVKPGGLLTSIFVEFGFTPAYGYRTASLLQSGTNTVSFTNLVQGLVGGYTYHYRVVASNALGLAVGPDQTYTPPATVQPGDLNNDGAIAQSELDPLLSNYWAHSPWIAITNVAGLGSTNVSFALPNPGAWVFPVQVSTNLATWTSAGSAAPYYRFTDPAATNTGIRYYRITSP